MNAPLPPVLQEDCTTVSTDAAGYAAYIDQSYTHNILWLWLLMAVVFTGIAVVFRRTPVRRVIIRKNGVVVGEAGSGSSGLILARSDVSQIKRVYYEMSPDEGDKFVRAGFAPIFPDTCYHLTHYWPAAADIPVASDNPAHYADAIRYNARTPLQGSLLPLTRLVWA